MTPPWRTLTLLAVFLGVSGTHLAGIVTSYDSVWSIPIARSLIREGNTDLDEYLPLLQAHDFYAIEVVDGHYYSIFPIGASLLAVPVVLAVDAAGVRLDRGKTEGLVASLVVGATATVVFSLARLCLGEVSALFVAFVFAFATAAWSTGSRGLWQHGPSMLMLATTLRLIIGARARPWMVQYASLPLALSFVIRPTNAISVAALSLFVLVRHRGHFLRYLVWAQVVVIPFIWYALAVYGAVLPPYYRLARIGHVATFMEALAGHLISPARGVFVFSPILLASLWGMWLTRRRPDPWLDRTLIAIVLLHWVVVSSFPHWWGGHAFGYRLMSDMLPYLMHFMIPAVGAVAALRGGRRTAAVAALAALTAISVFIHSRGVTTRRTYGWNARPVDVDRDPARVWDWRDLQFLRGLAWGRGGSQRETGPTRD